MRIPRKTKQSILKQREMRRWEQFSEYQNQKKEYWLAFVWIKRTFVRSQRVQRRLEYPEMSLKDLGSLLEKPLGKSGVNHRLKKIIEIADEAKKENE